jgi:hypothetical protein
MMNHQEAKQLTNQVFGHIQQARSIADLEGIFGKCAAIEPYRMKQEVYPRIYFSISAEEIEQLIADGMLVEDEDKSPGLNQGLSSKLTDPLAKLLYAALWKNGDLKKIKHIAKGIRENQSAKELPDEALVFYQFGRYLTKAPGQPIIDQHVIRAFGVLRSKDDLEIGKHRRLNALNKGHQGLIAAYLDWISSDALKPQLRGLEDYVYGVDQVLFALGRAMKVSKRAGK